MPKVNIVMDMSMYDLFLTCPERFKNRYKLNKGLPIKAAPLDKGTIIHVGCEFYYELLKQGMQYQDCVNTALMKMKEASVVDSNLEPDEVRHLLDTMEEYFDHWRVADQCFEIVDVEKSILYVLHEDDEVRIALSGKIDLIVSDNKYTNLPYDHKSFQRRGPVETLSNQFRNYCYGLKSTHIIVNRIGLQKSLKPEEKFLRVMLSYDHLQLERWRTNVIKQMMNYLQCEAEGYWPMNETSCNKFNRDCEYKGPCEASGDEAKIYKLQTDFIDIEPWDVTKVLKKSSAILEGKK